MDEQVIWIGGRPYVQAQQFSPYSMGMPFGFPQPPQQDNTSELLPLLTTLPALQASETADTVTAAELAAITVPADFAAGNATTDQVNQVKAVVEKMLAAQKKDIATDISSAAALRKQALLGALMGKGGGNNQNALLYAVLLGAF